jgi:hypothetical protein
VPSLLFNLNLFEPHATPKQMVNVARSFVIHLLISFESIIGPHLPFLIIEDKLYDTGNLAYGAQKSSCRLRSKSYVELATKDMIASSSLTCLRNTLV